MSRRKPISTTELAEWLVLDVRQVQRLAKEGILQSEGRGKFDLQSNVAAYIRYTRKRTTGTVRDEFLKEKEATQRIIRQQRELELAKARGQLINREHALLVLTNLFTTIKNHVLAIPSRCSRKVLGLKSQAEVHAAIRPECERSLREIADFDEDELVADAFKQSTNGKHDLKARKSRSR